MKGNYPNIKVVRRNAETSKYLQHSNKELGGYKPINDYRFLVTRQI
jgi:hypothetical protein